MASALYAKARQAFLNGDIDWANDNIRMILVDAADYTVDLTNHQYLSDVPAPSRVAVSGDFTGKTSTNGVADADDVTLSNVVGDQSEAIIIYQHTGVEGSSQLIAYLESDKVTGLPVTPNGGNILVTWDNGASKIFKL